MHEAAATHGDAFMWPYINQEDLAKPRTLPILLNSRGRYHPSVFAASDCDAMHLGKVSMVIVPIFLNNYVMTMNGMTKDEDYGKLIGWNEPTIPISRRIFKAAWKFLGERRVNPVPGSAGVHFRLDNTAHSVIF